jgi:hypothetical protein
MNLLGPELPLTRQQAHEIQPFGHLVKAADRIGRDRL